MIGNNEEYIQAYTEINCLLKHFPKEYINKLPTKLLNMIQSKSNKKYCIDVDIKKSLQYQNISKKTKDILVVLKYNYWSNVNEKENIKKKFYENEEKFQKELSEKYNVDNLFKKEILKTRKKESENISIVEYKEKWYLKLINKLKKLLKR